MEQIVHFPGEGLQDFRPGQSSPASSSFHSPAGSDDDANEPGDGVFRTFLHGKKCGVPGRSVRTCPGTSAHGPRRLLSSPGGFMSRRRRRRGRRKWRRRSTRRRCRSSTGGSKSTSRCPLLNAWRGGSGLSPMPPLLRPQLGRGGRGRRGARGSSPSPLLVCGYAAVGQGLLSRSSFSGAQCSLLLTTGTRCSTS